MVFRRWLWTWKLLGAVFNEKLDPDKFKSCPYRNSSTDGLFDFLVREYCSDAREYHTITHIMECFEFYDSIPDLPGKSARVELAIWFHDIIYNINSKDNELESAKFCKESLIEVGVDNNFAGEIANIILVDHKSITTDIEQQLLADVDLWILSSTPDRFELYEKQVRNEYKEITDDIFYPSRAKIMKSFLEKEYIYYIPEIRVLLEGRARTNLAKYLSCE